MFARKSRPMSHDTKLLLTSNALRNFGFGMLSILFVLYLAEIGFDPIEIGALITATLFGSAMLNLIVGSFTERVGRRRMMALSTGLMILSGLVLVLTSNPVVLFLTALTGALNMTGISNSAFVALDQATLPQLSPIGFRNRDFGAYNTAAFIARMGGALVSGAPNILHASAGIPLVDGYRFMLAAFVAVGVVSLACILKLSPAIEVEPISSPRKRSAFRLGSSRERVLRLSTLFGVDAFSSGLVTSSLIVLFFHQRFGVGAEVLGPAYAVARLLQATSYMAAVRLADRFGLLNTMVFTHLPSHFLLMALPLAPSLSIGIAILLLHQSVAHMDLPTRQAYVVALVQPEERTAAVGMTNLTRNLAQSISPTITGYTYQALVYTAPFLAAGLLGILYDVGLYMSFKKVHLHDEESTMNPGAFQA